MNSDMSFKEALNREIGDMRLNPQMVGKAIAVGRVRQRRRKLAATGGFFTAVAASVLLLANLFNRTPNIPPLSPSQTETTQAGETATAAAMPSPTPAPAPTETGESGERIQKTFVDQTGLNELHIDAVIPSYAGQSFPTAAISPKKFSQEQAEAIIQALVGDSLFYDPSKMTISHVNESIAFYTQRMNEADEEMKEGYQKIIRNLEAELKHAVPENEIPPASRIFKKVKEPVFNETIIGKFNKGGITCTMAICNDSSGEQSNVWMHAVGGTVYSIIARAADATPGQDPGISYEEAEAQAIKLAQDMGSGLTLADSFLGRDDDPESEESTKYAYIFEFTRAVNGVPVLYDATYLSPPGTEEENNKPGAKMPWPYELLTITICGQCVHDMDWYGPGKADAILNENVPMIPFEEVMARCEEEVFKKNWEIDTFRRVHGNDGKVIVNIDRITLGLARVQSGSEYTLLPVWDFYGSVEYLGSKGTTRPPISGNRS